MSFEPAYCYGGNTCASSTGSITDTRTSIWAARWQIMAGSVFLIRAASDPASPTLNSLNTAR